MPAKIKEPEKPDLRGQRRPLGPLAVKLLSGRHGPATPLRRLLVPWGASLPDKTLKAYGLRLRKVRDPQGRGYLCWVEVW